MSLKAINPNYVEKLILNKSVLENSYYSVMGRVMTNQEFLNGHKQNIENLIKKILGYKEYLSSDQVLYLEEIRESKFFHLLKVERSNKLYYEYYDDTETRKLIAKELNNLITYANKIS